MTKKVLVMGLGLIGSSLCRAIKQPNVHIFGWDKNAESCSVAKATGIIDEIMEDLTQAETMDFILLALPVQATLDYLKHLEKIPLKSTVIVSDTGSTKKMVMQLARSLPFCFVGGHPMAGSHKSGVTAADPHLFENAYYILTPGDQPQEKLERLKTLLRPTRGKFVLLDADVHDEIVGVLSHLPHMIAAGLVQTGNQLTESYPRADQLAAGGFRDITRIASSDPQMWTDILLTNREILLDLLDQWQQTIQTLEKNLQEKNQDAIFDFFHQAKRFRDNLPEHTQGTIPAFYDLLVDIPDVAGAVAQVMTVLSRAGLSIIDVKIQETREDIYGVLVVSFQKEEEVFKGKILLEAEKIHCKIRS